MAHLLLTSACTIPESDVDFNFARSSGPGGQNVNKLATKVELRFHLAQTQALSPARKQRLSNAFPSHVTSSGDFVIASDRFRSQRRNQADAIERLKEMIQSIWHPPRPRIKTRATKASKERRLSTKRQRSEIKRQRSAKTDG